MRCQPACSSHQAAQPGVAGSMHRCRGWPLSVWLASSSARRPQMVLRSCCQTRAAAAARPGRAAPVAAGPGGRAAADGHARAGPGPAAAPRPTGLAAPRIRRCRSRPRPLFRTDTGREQGSLLEEASRWQGPRQRVVARLRAMVQPRPLYRTKGAQPTCTICRALRLRQVARRASSSSR